MCAPSPPPPPNYAQAAQVQGDANLEAAKLTGLLSNPNINTPWGSQTVTVGPDYGGYLRDNPDILAHAQSIGQDPMNFAKYHYDTYGRDEGRILNDSGDRPTITQTFSPEGQRQFDSQNRIINSLNQTAESGLNRVSGAMATPFDMSRVQGYSANPSMTVDPSKLPGRTVSPSLTIDPSKASQYSVTPGVASYDDPIVKAIIERNQPEFDRRRSSTEADLLARGFNPGGSGYDARMGDIGKQENDLRLAALLAGGQEQSRVAGLESQRRAQDFAEMGLMGDDQSRVIGLESQIRGQSLGEQQALGQDQSRVLGAESSRRGQDIQEQAYLRQLPLTELNALRTGGMPSLPQFQAYQGAQVGAAPMFDATLAQGNAAQQTYQNQLGSYNNMMTGLFGLGGNIVKIPGLFD